MAREYPVKKGIKMSIEYISETAKGIAEDVHIEGDHVLAKIVGMKRIDMYTNGKNLLIETEHDESVKDFSQTIKIFNDLIERLTGFNSKERKKRFSKL